MSAIETYLQYIANKVWARDVRTAIVNAIRQCYDDVHNPTLNTEALQAAIQAKIDAGQMAALTIGDRTITAAKLALGVIPTPDTTLSQSGIPADAETVGDEIASVKADLDSLMEPKRLDDGTDLDTIKTPGVYTIHTNGTYIHMPTSGKEHGILEVWHEDINNVGRTFQRLTYTYKAGRTNIEIWVRSFSATTLTWNEWISVVNLGSFKASGGADKYFSNVKVYGSPANIGISNIRNNYGPDDAKQTGFAIFPTTTDTEWGSAIKNLSNIPISGHYKETLSDGRTYEFDYDLSGLTSGTRDIVRDAAHVIKKECFYDVPVVNSGMSDAAKAALINCFLKVAWIDDSGAYLIQALNTALYGGDAPADSRLVYELKNTDISNTGIDTEIPVFPLGDSFTVLVKATLNAWPSGKSTGILFNHGSLSTGTIRLGVDILNNALEFVTNVMYGDHYADAMPGYAGGAVSPNSAHAIMWMVRMSGTTVKKTLYIDGIKAFTKEENISSQASDKTFTGNYMISKIVASDTNNHFPGTVGMLRIYNAALSSSEIKAIMGVEF